MVHATSDAFLEGEGIPVDPRDIEAELARLWGPAAEQVGGPDLDHPTVTRVVLANLIVVSPRADGAGFVALLDGVVSHYPCRAIVLRLTDEADRRVHAEVSASCHLPAPGLPQVCSERIVLQAGPSALDLLPGAVRPVLEADLPCILWWTDDPRPTEALFGALAAESTRLILDLPDPGADPEALRFALDPKRAPFGRDIAWFGITRWRELVAQLFDLPGAGAELDRISSVEVRALAPSLERIPRVAVWLLAWLAGQLDWESCERLVPRAGQLIARFRGASGLIDVNITTETNPASSSAQLTGIRLTTRGTEGQGTFRLNRPAVGSEEVRVEVHAAQHCQLPRRVRAPELDAPRRLAAALESSRVDPPFQRALPHALWLLGA